METKKLIKGLTIYFEVSPLMEKGLTTNLKLKFGMYA